MRTLLLHDEAAEDGAVCWLGVPAAWGLSVQNVVLVLDSGLAPSCMVVRGQERSPRSGSRDPGAGLSGGLCCLGHGVCTTQGSRTLRVGA